MVDVVEVNVCLPCSSIVCPEVVEFSTSVEESFTTDGAVSKEANVLLTGGEEEVVCAVLTGVFEILVKAGVVLMVLGGEEDGLLERGVEVALSGPVVFLCDGGGVVLLRETEVLGGWPVVWNPEGGGCARTDLVTGGLLVFGGENELDFFPAADVKDTLGAAWEVWFVMFVEPATVLVDVLLVVATTEELIVGSGSSISGLITTNDVTGVTKLYFSERLVALSTRRRCMNTSEVLILSKSNSLIVK